VRRRDKANNAPPVTESDESSILLDGFITFHATAHFYTHLLNSTHQQKQQLHQESMIEISPE
jgi:hypothetical protein